VSTTLGEEKKGGARKDQVDTGRMSGEARRQQLIEVAIRLFSQKGFRGTTTKEIALSAKVNEAMIFRHFATKEDFYTAILDYKARQVRVEEWLEEFKKHALNNDDEALFRALARRVIEHHVRDKDFLRLMLYSALEGHELAGNFLERQVKPINEFFYSHILRRQREGAFRQGSPKAIMHGFIGMVSHHILTTRLFDFESARVSDKEIEGLFPLLFLNGLRASPATKSARK
jgi:TetR/AcrR family transcriptional regulator